MTIFTLIRGHILPTDSNAYAVTSAPTCYSVTSNIMQSFPLLRKPLHRKSFNHLEKLLDLKNEFGLRLLQISLATGHIIYIFNENIYGNTNLLYYNQVPGGFFLGKSFQN